MTKEQAELILTADSKGYGVRNVNERIKLYYGAEYAVCIDSEVGRGTTVTIHFPKNCMQKSNIHKNQHVSEIIDIYDETVPFIIMS